MGMSEKEEMGYESPRLDYGNAGMDYGNQRLSLTIPSDAKEGDTIHLILRVTDNGTPRLTHYRRAVVEIL